MLGLGLLLVGSSYAQQNPPLFTGKSAVMDGKDLSVARRSFEPGARTYWHSHDHGQLLLVEDGKLKSDFGFVDSRPKSAAFARELEAEIDHLRRFLNL